MRGVFVSGALMAVVLVTACRPTPEVAATSQAHASETSAVASPASATPARANPIRCGIEMRNVALHVADGVVLNVRSLDGEFVSRVAGEPPVFDDPRSYTLRIRVADLALDAASLTRLIQQQMAGFEASPIRDVRVTIADGALHAAGKLHKGVRVPFSMTAEVSAANDGSLRLHATKLKAAGVPMKGLLDLLGLDVGALMKMPQGSGIRADGDDLLLDTAAMLPPPRTEGRLQEVAVSGDRLTMRMTGPGVPPSRPSTRPLPSARNYLYFFGGRIRFGKLTMMDSDLQLIDAEPRDAFDFFPAHYEAQLVAGYSRNTPRKGLQVFMPDYARVAANGRKLKVPQIGQF
jgi:hypothetical protein